MGPFAPDEGGPRCGHRPEWLTSAFLEFHLGTCGMRPETIVGWGFDLPSGLIPLAWGGVGEDQEK